MKEITCTVQSEVGLHDEYAVNLVAEANRYKSDIYIVKDGRRLYLTRC
ncbi:HPr family phosphocarrier protein [Bariatricus sp. SGI.154]